MWEKVKKYFNQLSPARLIVAYYLVTVTISTILLSLPIARKEGEAWSLIDAIFTSVSAVSVTGLTTVNVSETFTLTGKWILLFVIQIGGIGIMTLGTFFWLIFRKKIGLKGRQLMMTDQNQMNLSGIVRLMKQIIIVFFLIEVIGAFVLSVYFLTYYPTWQEAFFYGIFMSVSATTNAGFDFTGASLMPFKQDYFVQTVHMMLIILGAIGFPVLIEVKDWLRKRKEHFHFSLFAKLTAMTYFSLVIFGAVFSYL